MNMPPQSLSGINWAQGSSADRQKLVPLVPASQGRSHLRISPNHVEVNNAFSVWQGAHNQLGPDLGTSPLVWHTRPDFVSMLADKFNNDLGDDCNDSAPDLVNSANKDHKQYSKDSRPC